MKEIKEVKKDLNELRKLTHAIKAIESAANTHKSRINLLSSLTQNDKIKELISKEEALLKDIYGADKIEQTQSLERVYMGAIMSLDPTDRSIALNTYINGLPYWKTGLEVGYTEEGVRKRIAKIVKQIAISL
jgi:DNA-directed RNA polymerase specialized sigma24 family protein